MGKVKNNNHSLDFVMYTNILSSPKELGFD